MLIPVICIIILSLIPAGIMYLLIKKQLKYVNTVKVGDKTMYNGIESEIIEIISENQYVLKTTVTGMMISPVKPKKTNRYGRKI